MSEFSPTVPLLTQIRKIIFDKFNETDMKFTNDEIFEIIKQGGDVDPSWTIDNMEKYFDELCKVGLIRNIAQNFTTQHFKLFSNLGKIQCKSCHQEIFLSPSEERICPNPQCGATI